MQEQLISIETAKLAKEKGFNVISNSFYCENYEGLCSESEEFLLVESLENVIYDCNNEFGEGERFHAPTQSLLQKWLREAHNIYVDSYHDLTADGKSIQYYTSWGFLQQKDIYGKQNVNGYYDEYNDWKTYEVALEQGLQEALKLIETTKQK